MHSERIRCILPCIRRFPAAYCGELQCSHFLVVINNSSITDLMDAVESFHHALVMQPSSESFHQYGPCFLVEQKPILPRNAVFEIDSSRNIPQPDSSMDFPGTGRFSVLADFFRQPDLKGLDPSLTGLQARVTKQACLFI